MGQQAVGNLAIILSANASPALAGFRQVEQTAQRSSANMTRAMSAGGSGGGMWKEMFKGNMAANFAQNAGQRVADFVKTGFAEAMRKESNQVGFDVLIGDPAKAKEFTGMIDGFAKSNALDPAPLMEMSRSFLDVARSSQEAFKYMVAVSKIAAVVGPDKAGNIATAVQQMLGKQELRAEEVTGQLAEAGFPIQELAKAAGRDMPSFRKEMEKGAVGVDVLRKALDNISQNRFGDALAKQAATAQGTMTKFEAQYKATAAALMSSAPVQGFVQEMTRALEGWEHVLEGRAGFGGLTAKGEEYFQQQIRGAQLAKEKLQQEASLTPAQREMKGFAAEITKQFGEKTGDTLRDTLERLKKVQAGALSGYIGADESRRAIGDLERKLTDAAGPSPIREAFDQLKFFREAAASGALRPGVANPAMMSIFAKLEGQFGGVLDKVRLPEARGRGTQAAESVISQAGSAKAIDRQEQVKRVVEAAVRELQRVERNTDDTAKALANLSFQTVGLN